MSSLDRFFVFLSGTIFILLGMWFDLDAVVAIGGGMCGVSFA